MHKMSFTLSVVILGVVLAVVSTAAFSIGRYTAPAGGYSVTWLYQSIDARGLAFGIKPTGEPVFGPGYDRDAEVKKFVEMARQAMFDTTYPRCYDASFWPREIIDPNLGLAAGQSMSSTSSPRWHPASAP